MSPTPLLSFLRHDARLGSARSAVGTCAAIARQYGLHASAVLQPGPFRAAAEGVRWVGLDGCRPSIPAVELLARVEGLVSASVPRVGLGVLHRHRGGGNDILALLR